MGLIDLKIKRRYEEFGSSKIDADADAAADAYAYAYDADPFRVFATRESRKSLAKYFLSTVSDSDDTVIQACICAACDMLSLTEQESKNRFSIPYLAVQGIDSTCVVVRNDHLETLLVNNKCALENTHAVAHFLRMFWNVITTEVEDIEDSMFQGNNMRPFAVVTAPLSKGCESSQASTAKYWVKKTCKFLWHEMKKDPGFTPEKTEQTAILAFHHFFSGFQTQYENPLGPDSGGRLRVYVREKNEGVGNELLHKRVIYDRKELLAALPRYPSYKIHGSGHLYPRKDKYLEHGFLRRRGDADVLQIIRKLGGCTSEQKICISPDGFIDKWDENLYGFTRVVVHGEDSVCAVARSEDWADVKRQAKEILQSVGINGNALVYEAEDLTLPCGDGNKMTSRHLTKPFVAVSVAPGHKGLDLSVVHLLGKMDWGTTDTLQGILKTAIFMLSKLFRRKFKAHQIEIFALSTSSWSSQLIEYPIRGRRSIKDYLKDVPCIGKRRRFDVSNKACKRMRLR